MPNPHKGDVAIKAGGAEYTFRFSIDALCQLEEHTGKTFMEIANVLQSGNVSMSLTRSLVWAGLREHHPKVSVKEAGDLIIQAGGIAGIMPTIAEALAAGFPEAKDGGENPPKGQDGTGPTSSSAGVASS